MQRSPILLTDSDHDVILDKIKSINTIGYERKTSVEYRCETVNVVFYVIMLFIIILINFTSVII